MTYGEMKELVLQLLHRYSVAGETVPLTYQDQADAVLRIPALTRDALYYIATSTRRLRTVAELAEPEEVGGWLAYDLPEDCYQLAAGLLRIRPDGTMKRERDYRLVGGRQVLTPRDRPGKLLVEYFRYPAVPVGLPEDDDFLDCPPEAQSAVAYYVAAHLSMEDDHYIHGALYNEFEMKMARLQEGQMVECGSTEDVYGLACVGG